MKAVLTTPEEAGPRRELPASGSRRARMVIKRVDPLSVLKVSLIFYLCMALVFDAVAIITYWSLSALGALGSVTDLLTSLGFGDPQTGFQIDVTRRLHQAGLRIAEVPVTFVERTRGRSKMTLGIVFEAMLRVTGWGIAARVRRW